MKGKDNGLNARLVTLEIFPSRSGSTYMAPCKYSHTQRPEQTAALQDLAPSFAKASPFHKWTVRFSEQSLRHCLFLPSHQYNVADSRVAENSIRYGSSGGAWLGNRKEQTQAKPPPLLVWL